MTGGKERCKLGDMPRQARLDAPGALHHVMGRGIEGVSIFRSDEDQEDFLRRLGALCEERQVICIYPYVPKVRLIMPNSKATKNYLEGKK